MMSDYTVFKNIKVSKKDIINCSYSNWYSHFKKYTAESIIFRPLQQEFIDYLISDGLKLPEIHDTIIANSDNDYSDWESEDENDVSTKKNLQNNPTNLFEDFHHELISTIEKLGGIVTPKLNWSAPKDAKWILLNNSLKCTNVNDIYLSLNASDHILHDLDHAFDDCTDSDENSNIPVEYELVLRKWIDINPALEFRIFINDRKIIGISQRDLNYYDYLENLKCQLHEKILEFFNNIIMPSKFSLSDFILDIYIPRPFEKVYIVDINPFSRKSDPLMFTWNELLTNSGDYEFRLITQNNVNQFSKKEFSENQVPIEIIDATMNADSMIQLAKNWSELQANAEKSKFFEK